MGFGYHPQTHTEQFNQAFNRCPLITVKPTDVAVWLRRSAVRFSGRTPKPPGSGTGPPELRFPPPPTPRTKVEIRDLSRSAPRTPSVDVNLLLEPHSKRLKDGAEHNPTGPSVVWTGKYPPMTSFITPGMPADPDSTAGLSELFEVQMSMRDKTRRSGL